MGSVPDLFWILWVGYLVLGLVIFLILEIHALRTPSTDEDDDTFSGYIWRNWVRKSKRRRRVVFFVLLSIQMLLLWLFPHFMLGIV